LLQIAQLGQSTLGSTLPTLFFIGNSLTAPQHVN
jgi:hypothetical protein